MKMFDWVAKPILNESESVGLVYPANHTQNGWRAVGGKLFVTNKRIIFVPNMLDDKLAGKSVEIAHEQVSEIFFKERSVSIRELFSGGLWERLGVRLADGTAHLFVVNDLHQVRGGIAEALSK